MRGFTLIESLVSTAIFIIIIASIYGIMNVANVHFSTDAGGVSLQQQVRNTMYWLTRETREASSVTVTTIDADKDSIIFDTPNESGIQYYLNGTQVIREYPSGNTKIIGDGITVFKFSQAGRILDISLTASRQVFLRQISFSLKEKVRLRNE